MRRSFGMKLGGLVPKYARSIADLPALAAEFERMGVDDVIHGEHILFAPRMPHPGEPAATHGRTGRRSDVSDVTVLLTAIATRTTRLKVVTGVVLAAAHPFALLAKQTATLDVLSGGRLVLGVGSGWFADEFQDRYAIMEETVRAVRKLWTSDISSFAGKWINYENMVSEPAPVTPGGVPVWWGGKSTAAMARRVATMGDGWIAAQAASYDDIALGMERIEAACGRAGRDFAEVGVRVTLPRMPGEGPWAKDAVIEHAVAAERRLSGLGVTHYTIPLDLYRLELDATEELVAVLAGDERC